MQEIPVHGKPDAGKLARPVWGEGKENLLLRNSKAFLFYSTDFKVRCASCGQTFNMSVNLADLPIKKLDGDPDATHTITLPRTGKKVTFRLLRGRDEKKIAATLRKTPQEIIRLSLYLHTVAVDESENFSEKFFETLPGADSQYYRREIDAVTCGVDTIVELECPECDNEFEVQLPISENFFFPNSRKT